MVQVATPVQAARADQLCFPHLPDVLAMCTVLSSRGQQLPHAFAPKTKSEQAAMDEASASPTYCLPQPLLALTSAACIRKQRMPFQLFLL